MESITLLDHPTFPIFQTLQQPRLQRELLQKVAEIALAIKGKIQAITEESQHVNHTVIDICMTRTSNEASSGIHILGEERKRREEKRKEKKTSLPTERRDLPNHYSILFRD